MGTARDSERTPVTGPRDGTSPEGEAGEEIVSATPVSGPVTGAGASGQLIFDDPLDRPSSDDTDGGWGASFSGAAEDDFTRFLNEKPPHHL
jgi:hypothetical protein